MCEEPREPRPLVERVADGLPQEALRKLAPLEFRQGTVQPLDPHPVVRAAFDFAPHRPGPALAQIRLPPVEQANLIEEPAGHSRRLLLRLEEVAPRVCPAAKEVQLLLLLGKGRIAP